MLNRLPVIRVLGAVVATLAVVFFASPLAAAGVGPRLGLTSGPDQLHVGAHVHASQMTPNVSFIPSFELGFGDDLTVLSGNMDIRYRFRLRSSSWHPFVGGGPAIHFVKADSNDNTEIGLNLLAGMITRTSMGRAFFGEVRFGAVDSPDVKFTIGWMFH